MLNHRLLDPEIQAYLQAHKEDDPAGFALKKSPFEAGLLYNHIII